MRDRIVGMAAIVVLAGRLTASAADTPATAATTTAAPTPKPLLVEPLTSAASAKWRVAKGSWKIVDGAWQGAELPADKHGAVARHDAKFHDAVIDFDFRLDGARTISLSINDKTGHLCRLVIRPDGFQALKDDHDHEGPDQRVPLGAEKRTFKPGQWYHARVELSGARMTARIGDGEPLGAAVGGEHPQLAGAKANVGFTVAGQSASFKNLKVAVPDGK